MTSTSMPAAPVLVEGHNLTLAAGTGIATYARQLTSALGEIGYKTDVLIGSEKGISKKDAVLAQISLFDAQRKPNLLTEIASEWRKLSIGPFAAKAASVAPDSTVIEGPSRRFAKFGKVHVVPHLVEREFAYFRRYGRRMPLALDTQPSLLHATRPAPIRVKGCPNIYTLHDIVPLRLPFTTMDDKKLYLGIIRDLCRVADHIVTVSEFSRRDIIAFTGIDEKRITNTYQAVTLPPRLLQRDEATVAREVKALFDLEMGEYFLFVGALEPKKNVSRLIDAYAASGVQRPLIITGGEGWMNQGDKDKIASERFLSYSIEGSRIRPERSVRRFPYLPLDHLTSLVRGARATLFPSIYEGFGLPVLEAMMLGTPVLTSNVSSLPEIAGGAAMLVDPYDIEAMARAIVTLDADADYRRELSQKGLIRAQAFSQDAYVARLRDLYAKLL